MPPDPQLSFNRHCHCMIFPSCHKHCCSPAQCLAYQQTRHEPVFRVVVAQLPVPTPSPRPHSPLCPKSHAMNSTGRHHDDLGPCEPLRPHERQHQLVCRVTVAQLAVVSITTAPNVAHTRQHQRMIAPTGQHHGRRCAIHLLAQPCRTLPRLPVAVPQLAEMSFAPGPQRPLLRHTGSVLVSSSHHDNSLAIKHLVSPAHESRQQLIRVRPEP
mmetsp:Transcript_41076/g.60420  ORF Transcript_41076/g.60420 Transcript_41076/m.60420 type:complete len:213 (+) Transcript_41076:525-1163(+)